MLKMRRFGGAVKHENEGVIHPRFWTLGKKRHPIRLNKVPFRIQRLLAQMSRA